MQSFGSVSNVLLLYVLYIRLLKNRRLIKSWRFFLRFIINCTVYKPAETQTNIRLAYHVVRAPNSKFCGREFESSVLWFHRRPVGYILLHWWSRRDHDMLTCSTLSVWLHLHKARSQEFSCTWEHDSNFSCNSKNSKGIRSQNFWSISIVANLYSRQKQC